tara:strand:- start:66 stop:1187 length:1122 start_codon:yes stop_codon:yes gene_type:complete
VSITSGLVEGHAVSDGYTSPHVPIAEFLGIPYAEPPVAALRWQPPVPRAPWQGTFQASQYGDSCVQTTMALINTTYQPQSEDCLSINVWTPMSALQQGTALLPVLVFVHGGGFILGSSNDPTLNGSSLSTNGPAVVVTFNYRLGGFGFLALEDLAQEQPQTHTTGNYGILDQQLALQWVKANIQSFGGDPERVTLFGQSAGGNSMFIHYVSQQSKDLFSAIIVESGFYRGYYDLPDGYAPGNSFVQSSPCNASMTSAALLNCLRSLPAQSVLNLTGSCQWLPVIDGYVLEDYADVLVEKGKFNRVPMMAGGVRNEGTITVDIIFGDSFGTLQYNTYTLALYTPLVGATEVCTLLVKRGQTFVEECLHTTHVAT